MQAERIHALGEAIRSLAQPQDDFAFVSNTAAQLKEALEATVKVGTREQMRILDEALRDLHPDDVELLAITLNDYRRPAGRKLA